MKNHLIACAFLSLMLAGCDTTPDQQETAISEPEMVDTDTVGVKMDNTRVEIEEASANVDSLLNEL